MSKKNKGPGFDGFRGKGRPAYKGKAKDNIVLRNKGNRHMYPSFDVHMTGLDGTMFDRSCNVCKHKDTKVCDDCTGYPGSKFERK